MHIRVHGFKKILITKTNQSYKLKIGKMAKQNFKLHSHQKMTGYMKKFSSIEKSLLFEVSGDRLIAKTHTPDKSVVKIGSILVTDVMDSVSNKEDVKVGLFSVDNFISSFKNFGDDEVKLEISGETVGDDVVATEMRALSKSLKISFPCASTSMFRYIDANLATKITDITSALFSFRVDKDLLGKVSSLASFDSDSDTLSVASKGGEIFFKGKSFELSLPGVSSENEGEISFYKSHFSFVDREDSEIFITDTKIIFKSLETDTVIVIGKVE
jgi:hypothetical protein